MLGEQQRAYKQTALFRLCCA